MKAKIFFLGLLVAGTAILFTACRKNKITGGATGGMATLNVAAQHSGHDIDSCWIYIKYNAVEAPVQTGYDDSALAAVKGVGRPIAAFRNLTTGNYYLYAKGYDPVYQQPATGGMAYTIDQEKEYYINLQMTVHK